LFAIFSGMGHIIVNNPYLSRKWDTHTKMEWARLIFHIVTGTAIVSIYGLSSIDKGLALIILGIIAVFFVAGDLLRLTNSRANNLARRIFKSLMRADERNSVAGTTYYVIGCWLSILIFDRLVACASILLLILGDGAAKLVGKKFGRRILCRNKTLEGTLANFLVSLTTVLLLGKLAGHPHFFLGSIIGALAATLAELIPRVDNLAVPLLGGLSLAGALYYLG